jgi:hypothetical protein
MSFLYGWFLGISPDLEAVAFEAIAYPGIGEVEDILDSIAIELPDAADPANLLQVALAEVCDEDSHGHRYDFHQPPACPACRSPKLSLVVESELPWPNPADTPTHVAWEAIDHQAKVAKIRAALGLGAAGI